MFSIIVPIYKVEAYLSKCIESVLVQDELYELILVDDGSPDKSGEIADEYAKNNSNIIVIHKPNGGLSDARNYGLDRAEGEYIIFLDSDDFLEKFALRNIQKKMISMPGADIYYADIIRTADGETGYKLRKRNLIPDKYYLGEDAINAELKGANKYMAMAQCGIYNREYLENNGFRFKKGILHEDEEWSPRVELKAKKIVYTGIAFYMYLYREDSITTTPFKKKNALDLLNSCEELGLIYKQVENNEVRKRLECYNAKLYLHAASVLLRNSVAVTINRNIVSGKWLTFKDFIRFGIFIMSPSIYANIIDKKFIK